MPVYDIREYVSILVSLFGVMVAIFDKGSTVVSGVGIGLTLFMAGFLAWHTWGRHNRSYTLQILSKENRGLSIRLLLTYSWLLYGEGKKMNKFHPSKLHISDAHYKYKFEKSHSNRNIFDMKCEFRFKLSSGLLSRLFLKDFDILILQPCGTLIDAIEYSFDGGYTYHAKTSPIHISDGGGKSPKLLKATIAFNDKKEINFLNISYTMAGVDQIDKKHLSQSIIACPFFYAKKIKNISFAIVYPENVGYRPKVVCLKKYPYDGKRYVSEKLLDFESENSFLKWTGHPKSHATQAIYVIEMHYPVKC